MSQPLDGAPAAPDADLLCSPLYPVQTVDDPARVARISDEIAFGFRALRDVTKAVSIFGSARAGRGSVEYELAAAVGAAVGRAGFAVLTGGGPGLMEAANRGAQEAGVASIGLNIALNREQEANPYLDLSLTFEHFFARKLMFVRYASAFVVLPGGFGTIDELFEALTLIQTQKIADFPVVLVGTDHWAGLIDWMHARLLGDGRIESGDLALLHVTDNPEEVADIVKCCHQARLGSG